MRKIKIFITVFVLYEFVMLTILQIPDYCSALFNMNFCRSSFRYFLICIALPGTVCLFIWWIPEILQKFCKKCQCDTAVTDDSPTKNILSEMISKQDIERFITAAVIMGIQKFISKHPKTKKKIDNVLDVIEGTRNKT